MSQSAIRCSGSFWEWISRRKARISNVGSDGHNIKSLRHHEVTVAIQIYVNRFRFTGETDNLACECRRVLAGEVCGVQNPKLKRRAKKENTKPGTWRHQIACGDARDGFHAVTTPAFKGWFDVTNASLTHLEDRPLTHIELADTLMSFIRSNRYSRKSDFPKICSEVAASWRPHWDDRKDLL